MSTEEEIDLLAELDSGVREADCEHAWESRLRGGVPIAVRLCSLCRAVDWDDLQQEIGDLDKRRITSGWLSPDEAERLQEDLFEARVALAGLLARWQRGQPVIDAARELVAAPFGLRNDAFQKLRAALADSPPEGLKQ